MVMQEFLHYNRLLKQQHSINLTMLLIEKMMRLGAIITGIALLKLILYFKMFLHGSPGAVAAQAEVRQLLVNVE